MELMNHRCVDSRSRVNVSTSLTCLPCRWEVEKLSIFFYIFHPIEESVTFAKRSSLCMVQFYLLPSPPGNPGDKSSPSVPGVENCLKPTCPGGRRAGQIENNFLLFL